MTTYERHDICKSDSAQQIVLTTATTDGDQELPRLANIDKSATSTCGNIFLKPLKQTTKPMTRNKIRSRRPDRSPVLRAVTDWGDYNGAHNVSNGAISNGRTSSSLVEYESEFIQELLEDGKKNLVRKFNFPFRYIESILSFNNVVLKLLSRWYVMPRLDVSPKKLLRRHYNLDDTYLVFVS